MARTGNNMNAGNGDMDRMRYINVTTIDTVGAATMTQIMTTDFQAAREYLRAKVTEMALRSVRNTWDRPVIAAYIYDTASDTLRRYTVTNHDITLPTIEEVAQ